jgi:hypothetical protein
LAARGCGETKTESFASACDGQSSWRRSHPSLSRPLSAVSRRSEDRRKAGRGHLNSPPSSSSITAGRWKQLSIGVVCMVMVAKLQYGWTLFESSFVHQRKNHRQERPLVSKTPQWRDLQEYLGRRATGGIATSGLILMFFVRRLTRGRIEVAAPESTAVFIEPSRKQL